MKVESDRLAETEGCRLGMEFAGEMALKGLGTKHKEIAQGIIQAK